MTEPTTRIPAPDETITDPRALARDLGGNVSTVYRDPSYKTTRWTWTNYTPQGGSGTGGNRRNKTGALVAASQMASPLVILEATNQGKDAYGYPACPDRYRVAAERRTA